MMATNDTVCVGPFHKSLILHMNISVWHGLIINKTENNSQFIQVKLIFKHFFYFQIENVTMEVPFPKAVLNVTLTPSQGKYTFDPVSKIMTWDVGRIDTTKLPNIKGNVCIL